MIPDFQKTIAFFERLYEGLEILVDFFHANEKGLPMTCIRSKLYEVCVAGGKGKKYFIITPWS